MTEKASQFKIKPNLLPKMAAQLNDHRNTGGFSRKLSVSAFKYPYWSKPRLINLKLFLTFCQALIIQKSHRCQNL